MSNEPPPVGPDPADDPTALTPPGPASGPAPLPASVPPPGPPMLPASEPPAVPPMLPASQPPAGPPRGALGNPYAAPERPRLQWLLVVVGIPLGFVAWVVGSFAVLAVSGTLGGGTGAGSAVALAVLVLGFLAAVGLVVWPRTRRLGQGFVLGAAIGLIVAGGLCIPLVSTF